MKRGLAHFWYQFKNWFRIKVGPGEPLTFLCGSEDELRRVTTWICHAYPQIFQRHNWAAVLYTAKLSKDSVNDGSGACSNIQCLISSEAEVKSITALCDFAWQYNQFTGTQWRKYYAFLSHQDGFHRPGFPYWVGLVEGNFRLQIDVNPPSVREHAEALIALSEWLDGKVSEQEKRELLQLPDDVEV